MFELLALAIGAYFAGPVIGSAASMASSVAAQQAATNAQRKAAMRARDVALAQMSKSNAKTRVPRVGR